MTTPAQYEEAMRALIMALADEHTQHPTGLKAALAIVREARERDVNARGAEAAQSLYDRAFNRTEVPDAR